LHSVLGDIRAGCIDGQRNGESPLFAALEATQEKFASVWKNEATLRQIVCFCVTMGAQCILDEKDDEARRMSVCAYFIEQIIALEFFSQSTIHIYRVLELIKCDLHTVVSFFRKRIPCKCLDVKYEEVKTVTKMGICSNPDCSLPERKTERNKILYCAQCDQVCYCSRACQKSHWKKHKKICKEIAYLKADFDSKERP
jgi:hypothetical protein